jgi:hypothetical protein
VAANRAAVETKYLKQVVDFLQDREADIWEPLFAIASIAVPKRIDELKRIALNLSGEKKKLDVDESESLRLLADIRTIFDKSRSRRIHTDDLLIDLRLMPETPWEDLKATKVSKLLRPFGIAPKHLWINNKNRRGYELNDFANQSRNPFGNGTPSPAGFAETAANDIKTPAKPKIPTSLRCIGAPPERDCETRKYHWVASQSILSS